MIEYNELFERKMSTLSLNRITNSASTFTILFRIRKKESKIEWDLIGLPKSHFDVVCSSHTQFFANVFNMAPVFFFQSSGKS